MQVEILNFGMTKILPLFILHLLQVIKDVLSFFIPILCVLILPFFSSLDLVNSSSCRPHPSIACYFQFN